MTEPSVVVTTGFHSKYITWEAGAETLLVVSSQREIAVPTTATTPYIGGMAVSTTQRTGSMSSHGPGLDT